MRTRKLLISGQVQGVFFRNFIIEKAKEFDMKGFCRNMDDGSVEVVIEGKDESVEHMIRECRKGPPHARVDSIKIEDMPHQGFDSFKKLSM
jgi:acylphosphatase